MENLVFRFGFKWRKNFYINSTNKRKQKHLKTNRHTSRLRDFSISHRHATDVTNKVSLQTKHRHPLSFIKNMGYHGNDRNKNMELYSEMQREVFFFLFFRYKKNRRNGGRLQDTCRFLIHLAMQRKCHTHMTFSMTIFFSLCCKFCVSKEISSELFKAKLSHTNECHVNKSRKRKQKYRFCKQFAMNELKLK